MRYYKAELQDFTVGRIYEERLPSGIWQVNQVTSELFDPSTHQMEDLMYNLSKSASRQMVTYRIKYLDEYDIEGFGFEFFEENNGIKRYGTNREPDFRINHNPVTHLVEFWRQHSIMNNGVEEEMLFVGYIVDAKELMDVLIYCRMYMDKDRLERKLEIQLEK